MEGFGSPGKIPTVKHNPMDLRHSPHSEHPGGLAHKEDIGTIDTDEHGWMDAERQARIYASMGLTLRGAVYAICGVMNPDDPRAAIPDGNHPDVYLHYIASGLGLDPHTPMTEVLKIPAV